LLLISNHQIDLSMNLSEEQIKSILQHTEPKIESELHLEDMIIDEVKNLQLYDQDIQKSKRKAKVSLWISLGTAVCLVISLLYNLIFTSTRQSDGLQNMLPTFMVIVVLLMLHQLLHFGQNLHKKAKA